MSWVGWAVIGLFVLIGCIMGYMVWLIYEDDKRRGGR